MKKVFLLTLFFIITSSLSFRSAAEDYPLVSTLFKKERSTKEDIIFFRNRDTLRGQVINDQISIATQYGMFSIPVRNCAGISFKGAQANNESIVTVNFNRFTGIITDSIIKFKVSSSGTVIPVRKEKILYVLLKKNDANELALQSNNEQSDLFVMTNGDLLSGEPVDRKITVTTDNARITLSFSDIKTIKMLGGDNTAAAVTKANGDTVKGSLDTNEISIDLELGITIKSIYKDRFNWIFVDQARKKAPDQFALSTPEGYESDGASFPLAGGLLEQTINVNLEPLLGKRGTRMKLALIPAGNFVMGSGATEEGRKEDEGPVREVTVSKPFYMGVYEVTQEQYIAVMGYNPSSFNEPGNPVEYVSWGEAMAFCIKMREKTELEVTLPTEAEWEYAARADSRTRFYFGDNYSELDNYAWYKKNSGDRTHPVGRKKPNKFGLYDMHGNVFEWCMDWYQGNYSKLTDKDPVGPKLGSNHVIRGGCWYSEAKICRSSNRIYATPDYRSNGLGFRVIIVLPGR